MNAAALVVPNSLGPIAIIGGGIGGTALAAALQQLGVTAAVGQDHTTGFSPFHRVLSSTGIVGLYARKQTPSRPYTKTGLREGRRLRGASAGLRPDHAAGASLSFFLASRPPGGSSCFFIYFMRTFTRRCDSRGARTIFSLRTLICSNRTL